MEWQTFGNAAAAAVVLIGIITPLFRLNASITKLTTLLEQLQTNLKQLECDNRDSHRRLWEHTVGQDEKLNACEHRLTVLETVPERPRAYPN